MVITKEPVYHYVPLSKNDDTVVIQYTMTTVEELGLLKMDFLGLRNLTVIDDAEKLIHKREPEFNIHTVPDGDEATYQMISAGRTSGVFQMESTGIDRRLREPASTEHRGSHRYCVAVPARTHGQHSQVYCQ